MEDQAQNIAKGQPLSQLVPQTREAMLEDLLLRLVDPQTLFRHLRRVEGGDELVAELLPPDHPPAQVISRVVRVLEQHGWLDDGSFFYLLYRIRPKRRLQIEEIARYWNIHITDSNSMQQVVVKFEVQISHLDLKKTTELLNAISSIMGISVKQLTSIKEGSVKFYFDIDPEKIDDLMISARFANETSGVPISARIARSGTVRRQTLTEKPTDSTNNWPPDFPRPQQIRYLSPLDKRVLLLLSVGRGLRLPRGACFANADLVFTNLKDADLSRVDLSGSLLDGADLSGANLRGTNLFQAHLSETNLSNADLRNAHLGSIIGTGVNLTGACLAGADLTSARLLSPKFAEADCEGLTCKFANLHHADFTGANLENANLNNSRLEFSNLQGADLQSASLQHARLSSANLQLANLSDADLSDANLESADLRGANLRGANLLGADFPWALFFGANLNDAILEYQRAEAAFFETGSTFKGAVFTGLNRPKASNAVENASYAIQQLFGGVIGKRAGARDGLPAAAEFRKATFSKLTWDNFEGHRLASVKNLEGTVWATATNPRALENSSSFQPDGASEASFEELKPSEDHGRSVASVALEALLDPRGHHMPIAAHQKSEPSPLRDNKDQTDESRTHSSDQDKAG